MHHPAPIPTSLKVVAFLFTFSGICSLIEVFVALTRGHININFGVLGLFIGPGLLRLSPGWRTCALVLLWIGMISLPIATIAIMTAPGPLDLQLFWQNAGQVPQGFGVALAALLFGLALWEYRVLTRPYVRWLFGVPQSVRGHEPGFQDGDWRSTR